MNVNFSLNLIKGRIKRLIIINIILFFLIYQALFIYGIKIFFFESTLPDYGFAYTNEIQTTKQEDETVALVKNILIKGHELSESPYKLFIGSLSLNDKARAFLDANSGTIELNIIKPLITSTTAETVLSTKKIIVKDGYRLSHLREAFKIICIYCAYQIEKKDKSKVISGIDSLISLYSFSQKGFDGAKPLISGMVSIALSKMMSETINKALESDQIKFTPEELTTLFNKLKILPAISDDFFGCMAYEKILIKNAINDFIMFQYNKNFIKMTAVLVMLKTLDLYYGSFSEQYETIMNTAINLKNKPYSEIVNTAKLLEKELSYSNLGLFTSKYHPLILIVVPSYHNAYLQDLISQLQLKGAMLKIVALREKILTGKVPQTLDELVKISGYGNPEFNLEIDNFTQKPLVYKVSETGEVLIYSAGPNMIDNGGNFSPITKEYEKADIDIKL